MGLRLNVDLETSLGPSQEVYARIESIIYNKFTASVMFQIAYWLTQDHAKKATRVFLDEELKNMTGMVHDKVLYYADGDTEGAEVTLPMHFSVEAVYDSEVEVPVYETKIEEKKIPYISFDENGDEITLHRTVSEEVQVQVGTSKEVKKVIDQQVSNRLADFSYEVLQKELTKWFPKDNIETVK